MRRFLLALTSVLFVLSSEFSVVSFQRAEGALVVVGGGDTNDAVVARTLALAGGRNAVVAVLPQSSALADAGDSCVAMWKKAGAKDARTVSFDESTAVIVNGTRLDVVGRSAAIVIDARRGTLAPASAGAVAAGTGLAFHVLRSGMTLDLARP